MTRCSWLAGLSCLLFATAAVSAADSPAAFRDALAVWTMRDLNDSADANSLLSPHGDVAIKAHVNGSNDGFVAELNGGWLDAGQGAEQELQLSGDQFTALIRIQCRSDSGWSTRGFFTKGGGHDQLVFNFFSHDFEQGPKRMKVGCEVGIEGKPGLGGQVTAFVQQIGPTDWHDLVARYDGKELALFVDGVMLDRKLVGGQLRQGNTSPVAIGSGGGGDNPFPGLVDHAALWQRALSDEEIVALSGGPESVSRSAAKFASFVPVPAERSARELVDALRELQHKFQHDPHRPRYHFLMPEEGETMPGDPNGAIWWKGRYHLFYIFQRHQESQPRTVHCWGHASSIDLLHWEHHPTALDVAPDDPDRGIFSGNAFVTKEGTPLILYHGVSIGNSIALAQDDGLIRWEKSAANPIVPSPKPGEPEFGKYDSWDPHGWLEGDTYYAIFGGNPQSGTGPGLFQGPDMTELKFVRPFLDNDTWSEAEEDISCPDFFRIGDKHVLLCISHMRGTRYFLGKWEHEQFTPESHARMNWAGGQFFAPETLLDDHGRRILWGWCLDERPHATRVASGWSGVLSLPRVLSLSDDGTLRIEPVEELQRLRINERSLNSLKLASGSEHVLPDIAGDSLELEVELHPGTAAECGVNVRRSPQAEEVTSIVYNRAQHTLSIDVSKSTLDPAIRYRTWVISRPSNPEDAERRVTIQTAPLALADDEPLKLRIFLDRSMLEVFANGRQCVTQRLWPTRPDARGISLFSRSGDCVMSRLKAWQMAATRPD